LIRCSTKPVVKHSPLVYPAPGIQATLPTSANNFSLCWPRWRTTWPSEVSAGHPCMTISAGRRRRCSVVRLRTRPKHPPPPDLPIRGHFQGHGRGLIPPPCRSGTVDRVSLSNSHPASHRTKASEGCQLHGSPKVQDHHFSPGADRTFRFQDSSFDTRGPMRPAKVPSLVGCDRPSLVFS